MLSDVLDSFVTEAAHGSIRVAKHRKSDKVELKDASFYLGPFCPHLLPAFDHPY